MCVWRVICFFARLDSRSKPKPRSKQMILTHVYPNPTESLPPSAAMSCEVRIRLCSGAPEEFVAAWNGPEHPSRPHADHKGAREFVTGGWVLVRMKLFFPINLFATPPGTGECTPT